MKKNQNEAQLDNTQAVKGRSSEAEELERKRLEIIKDIEDLMEEYARITDDNRFTKRKFKMGKAPNDFGSK